MDQSVSVREKKKVKQLYGFENKPEVSVKEKSVYDPLKVLY